MVPWQTSTAWPPRSTTCSHSRRPFNGPISEVLAAVATREPVPASRLRPGIPRDAQAILDHGMARSPGSRYPSLAAMESDLKALLAHRPVSVRPHGTLTRWFRRVRRSRLLLGAAAATVVIVGALGAWRWRVLEERARVVAFQGPWEEVPANYGVNAAASRYIRDPELRASVAATFDRLVESQHQVGVALALRAAFRFDHGHFEDAARDMERLADALPGPVAGFLAKRYRSIAVQVSKEPAMGTLPTKLEVPLDDAPAFESPLGRYLTGFHAARVGEYDDAATLLADPSLNGNRHAEALRLMFGASDVLRAERAAGDDPGAHEALDVMRAELAAQVQGLISASGYGGATEWNALALVRERQGRWADCLRACENGLETAPASLPLLQNGAVAAFHLRKLDLAESLAETGLRVVPGYARLAKPLAKTRALQGDFEGARQVLNDAGFGTSSRAKALRNAQLLGIAVMEAETYLDSDPPRAAEAVARGFRICQELPDGFRCASERPPRARGPCERQARRVLPHGAHTARRAPLLHRTLPSHASSVARVHFGRRAGAPEPLAREPRPLSPGAHRRGVPLVHSSL